MTTTDEPDLEGLLEYLGIELGDSTPKEVYGKCPGHKKNLGREDRSPGTWSVRRDTGGHFCFACAYGGSLTDLIEELAECSHWNALGLCRKFGIDLANLSELPDVYVKRKQAEAPSLILSENVLRFTTKVPRREREKRGLSAEALAHYGIRWDPDEEQWVTPIRLPGGALIGYQAKNKRYFDNWPKGVQKSTTLFGADVFEEGATAILMESPLDCPRVWDAGFEGAVASFGVYVSDDQMRLLTQITDEVILALDNEEIGEWQTWWLINGWRMGSKRKGTKWGTKLDLLVFNYRGVTGKDPGDMTNDEIERAIETAVPADEWTPLHIDPELLKEPSYARRS